ncbi:MAG: CPBP family intramembrane metalloprotease [Candidatus Omnitrophica bacterium]|nr:CPBP family intramembrane metalloprotease [Candidatus Omnitrophota bacterium]
MKKHKYILLTALCVLIIIAIKTMAPSSIRDDTNLKDTFNKEVVIQKMIEAEKSKDPSFYVFTVLSLSYLLLIIAGIINLFVFFVRSLQKKSLIAAKEKQKILPLSYQQISRIFFDISLLFLVVYTINFASRTLNWGTYIHNAINFNLAIEIGIIVIILWAISPSLRLNLKKPYLLSTLQLYTATLPLIILTAILLKAIGIESQPNPAIKLLFSLENKTIIYILLAQITLVGPIAEEIFFRGFIFKLSRKKYSFLLSAALTSLIFASMHMITELILPLFIISMAMCYLYEKTQNIVAPIIFHSIFNSANIILLLSIKNVLG